jgi:hypothetical protein
LTPFFFDSGEQSVMARAAAFNGLWWNPTPTAHIVRWHFALGAELSDQPFSVPSQGTVFANIGIPPGNGMGGLRVQYSGGMDDLLVAAGVEDDTTGFSANLPVTMPSMDSKLRPLHNRERATKRASISGQAFPMQLYNPGESRQVTIPEFSGTFYQHQFGACCVPTTAQMASAVSALEAGVTWRLA